MVGLETIELTAESFDNSMEASMPSPSPDTALLRTDGPRVVNAAGEQVRLRGVGLGGWMNMENFITGYPSTESLMRAAVADAIGAGPAELFFERLLSAFYADADAWTKGSQP